MLQVVLHAIDDLPHSQQGLISTATRLVAVQQSWRQWLALEMRHFLHIKDIWHSEMHYCGMKFTIADKSGKRNHCIIVKSRRGMFSLHRIIDKNPEGADNCGVICKCLAGRLVN